MTKKVGITNVHVCAFCSKEYKSLRYFEPHLEKCRVKYQTPRVKSRIAESKEVYFKIALYVYIGYYENYDCTKTIAQFITSNVYDGFIKFGKFCLPLYSYHVSAYSKYLFDNKVKIHDWTNNDTYTNYIYDLMISEVPGDALERAIEYSIYWAKINTTQSYDIIRSNTHSTICYYIINGYISPWILYNCKSGNTFLDTISDEHKEILWPFINTSVWSIKLENAPKQNMFIRKTLNKLGW